METDYGGISTYYYRGDATETYLEETHNAQGALTGRKITETDPQTGSTVTNMAYTKTMVPILPRSTAYWIRMATS